MSFLADMLELHECGTKEKRKALAKKIKSKRKDKVEQLDVDNTAYAGKVNGWQGSSGWTTPDRDQ